MSDERFNDAIRDALLADDPGTVPVRLKARMAMIPTETAGDVASSPWRDRFARYALPMGVLAAAAIIVVVFGGIALRGQQTASVVPSVPSLAPSGVPSAVPSADASPSGEPSGGPSSAPSVSATPAPLPTGPIAFDPTKVIGLMEGTWAINGNLAYHVGHADIVSSPGIGTIGLTDSSQLGTIVSLANGHDISAYALSNAGVVWMETWYTDKPIDCGNSIPCSPHGGQPVSWALNLTTLDGATTTKLDSGVVSRLSVEGEGSTPLPPEMAAQGNRVAYAVPRTVSGQPQASRIIVRSLPDGALIRTLDTSGYIGQVGVFGQALIYRRAAVTTGPTDPSNAYLNVVVDDASQPFTLDSPVAQASISDGGTGGTVRIAWVPGYGVTPSLRWANLGDTKFHTVDVLNAALTAFDPVVIGDGYAWLGDVESGDGTATMQVQVWAPGWAKARLVPQLSSPDSLFSTNGWLLASGGQIAVLESMGAPGNAVAAIRASDLLGQ